VYVCGSDHTCRPDVHRFFLAGVLDDFGGDVAKGAGERDERGELFIGRMEKFCAVKR